MPAWWTKDKDNTLFSMAAIGREDLQLLGDWTFVVGVPWYFPEEFKRYVFAGAKAACLGNRSIDYTLKRYGGNWKEFDLDSDTKLLYDATDAVKREIMSVLEYAKSIANKPNHHGVVAAAMAVVRLQQSFAIANLTIREGLHFETNAIQRVILEQLSWCYAIRGLEDEVFQVKPQKCIGKLRKLYPEAGWLYGDLSATSHMHPERTCRYVQVLNGELAVLLTQRNWSALDAFLSLILADLFGVVVESLYADVITQPRYLARQPSDALRLNANRPMLDVLRRFKQPLLDWLLREQPQHENGQ
jgi:hypothetical protein